MSITINEKFLVSRMQQRKGERINLPQPLESGELGWAYDTKQLFIGADERYPVTGVEIYNMSPVGSEEVANRILNNQIIQIVSTNIPGNVIIEEVVSLTSEDARVPTEVEIAQFAEDFRSYLYDQTIEIIATLNNWNATEISHYNRAQEDGYASDKYVLFSRYEIVDQPVFDNDGLFVSGGTYRFHFFIGFLDHYIYDENGENAKTAAVISEYLNINDPNSLYDDFIVNVSTNLKNFENNFLDSDFHEDSGNIAQLINLLSFSLDDEYKTGLVTTRQNIEIITEFTPQNVDSLIDPLVHVLPQTYTTNVTLPNDLDVATATSTLNVDAVDIITITNQGFGYDSVPNVTISGGDGSGATAEATISDNKVDFVNVTNGGSGYTSAPDVIIDAPQGFPSIDENSDYYYSFADTHFTFEALSSFHVLLSYEIYNPANDINNTIYHSAGTLNILNNYGSKITHLTDERNELFDNTLQKSIEFKTYFDQNSNPSVVKLLYRHNFDEDIGFRVRSITWIKP